MKTELLEPNPSSFIPSLRSVGYSLETAVADIIDNSISAGASEVHIWFDEEKQNFVLIDNGNGMTASELREAMRLGSTSPLKKRATSDLGRFGLGMKTASFSICKKLTVVTSVNGEVAAAGWDLDTVVQNNSWDLAVLSGDDIKKLPFIDKLSKNGTAIVWEKIDRIVDPTCTFKQKEFTKAISRLEKHLQITFHRFLEGEKGINKVTIFINNNEVEPFDPFNKTNKATQVLPIDKVQIGDESIIITPYILPHHDKTKGGEYDKYAWDGGYLSNQGFYIYRNKRLIYHGGWFRLAAPSNLTKLARVQVDIPNSLDEEWGIDVKKSTATPPSVIRERLKSTIDKIIGKSRNTYVARGKIINSSDVTHVWQQVVDNNHIYYKINVEHPLILKIREFMKDSKQESDFISLLDIISKSFPTDLLFSDYAAHPTSVTQNCYDEEALMETASNYINELVNSGMSLEKAIGTTCMISPFNEFEAAIRKKMGEKND